MIQDKKGKKERVQKIVEKTHRSHTWQSIVDCVPFNHRNYSVAGQEIKSKSILVA
jgi:hypothetical protein